MECSTAKTYIDRFLEISPDERKLLEAHVRECQFCSGFYSIVKNILAGSKNPGMLLAGLKNYNVLEHASGTPIVRMAHIILEQAIIEEASEIHIEPAAREMSIFFETQGRLREKMRIPKELELPLIAQYKLKAGLIEQAEKNVFLSGHFQVDFERRTYLIEVDASVGDFGERVTLRIGELG